MGTGIHGGFGGTLGSTYQNDTNGTEEKSYSDRGISIPENLKTLLVKMPHKGDYVKGTKSDFSMTDVSILSKEARVEFAKVTIGDNSYLIRGDSKGAFVPEHLLSELKKGNGKLEFHSHPHNDDLVPSLYDRQTMAHLKRITGQQYSTIVTPNGRTSTFNENGVIETGTVSNTIDNNLKKIYYEMFGGK